MARWRLWLGLAISLVFLYWLSTQVGDWGRVAQALSGAQYSFLIPALAAYFVGVWVRAVRWHYLLRPVCEVPARRLFSIVVIGYMANDILPARIGEFVRAYVLSERVGVSKSATLGTIVVERLCDGLALLCFMLAVALVMPFSQTLQQIAWVTAALFLGLLVALAVFAARPGWAERLVGLVLRPFPARYALPLARVASAGLSGLRSLRSARVFGTAFALSLLAWLCEAAMYYLVGLGFFPWLGPEAMLLTVAVANVGAMIPSSPGYVGTFDALAVFTLGLFGVAGELAFGYTAVLHAALILPVTLLGFFFLWRENLTLASLTRLPLRTSRPAESTLE